MPKLWLGGTEHADPIKVCKFNTQATLLPCSVIGSTRRSERLSLGSYPNKAAWVLVKEHQLSDLIPEESAQIIFTRWCNGSIAGFEPVGRGS